jgi:hypothetical protein
MLFFCLILFGLISTKSEGERLMWWQFRELNCIPLLSVFMHLAQSYRSNLYSSFLNKGVMLYKVLLCCWLMCPKCLEYITGASCTVTHCMFVSDCSEMLQFILLIKRALVFYLTPKHRPLCTVLPKSIFEYETSTILGSSWKLYLCHWRFKLNSWSEMV